MLNSVQIAEKKILIVDDDPVILEVIEELLGLEFLTVDKALDAETAFFKILEEPFSLLLCDIELPKFSGIELVQRLRADGITIPVVFLSSNLNENKQNMAAAVNPHAVLPKPFDIDSLIKAIRECIS